MSATLATGSKVCPVCGVERPLDDFPRDKSKASGRSSRCRPCDNSRSRRYYEANSDRVIARVTARRPATKTRICRRCDALTPSGRHHYCDSCRPIVRAEKERVRARGRDFRSTAERGYGARHQRTRKDWVPIVEAGGVRCARGAECLYAVDGVPGLIEPYGRWDLDHTDDRSEYLGPSHVRCNRATALRLAARTSRSW